jgi:hypothetical protein
VARLCVVWTGGSGWGRIAPHGFTGGEVSKRPVGKSWGGEIAGLYAGKSKRETARPTAERLLEAFQEITLTVIKLPEQTMCHVTPLSSVQLRVLEILGFSAESAKISHMFHIFAYRTSMIM